jgi:Flp pilus assembly protein TadD
MFFAFRNLVVTLSVLGLGFHSVGCRTVQARNPIAAARPAPVGSPPASEVPARLEAKSADQLFAEATSAYESGRDEDARSLFTQVLERAPTMVNAQYNLGVIAERHGEMEQARAAYQAALKIEPSHAPSALNLGRICLSNGELDQAIELLEASIRQPTKEYELPLLNNLAAAYRMAHKYGKAEATSRAVLRKRTDDVDALKNLALVYYEEGRHRLAQLVGVTAEKIAPNDPGIHNDLGLVYLKLDQRARAREEFRRSLALEPRFASAHRNLGALALAYRDYPTAQKSFAELVSLEPRSYEAHLGFGYALQGQLVRDPSKARAAASEFEKALALKPDNTDAICGAGWSYSEDRENWNKAVAYLDKCGSSPATVASERRDAKARQEKLDQLLREEEGEDVPAGGEMP